MYRVRINKVKKIKDLLNAVECDFIDVFLSRDGCLLVVNNIELFGYLLLEVKATAKEKALAFRFLKSDLLKLVSDGYIDFEKEDDGQICAHFMTEDATERLKLRFAHQIIASETYEQKMELVNGVKSKRYDSFDFSVIKDVCKFGKLVGGIVTVGEGFACVKTPNGRVYRRVDSSQSFSINAKSLGGLLNNDKVALNINNYLGIVGERDALLANKCRGFSNDELPLVEQLGSCYKADVKLGNLFGVLNLLKGEKGEITFDFNKKEIVMTRERTTMVIPLYCENERKMVEEVPVRSINTSFLCTIYSLLSSGNVAVSIKKNFTLFDIDGLKVAF